MNIHTVDFACIPSAFRYCVVLVREVENFKDGPLQMYLLGNTLIFCLTQKKPQTVCSPYVVFMAAGFA